MCVPTDIWVLCLHVNFSAFEDLYFDKTTLFNLLDKLGIGTDYLFVSTNKADEFFIEHFIINIQYKINY